MTLFTAIASGPIVGVVLAFLWVAFWTIFVQQEMPFLFWSGHSGLVVPIFLLGTIVTWGALLLGCMRS